MNKLQESGTHYFQWLFLALLLFCENISNIKSHPSSSTEQKEPGSANEQLAYLHSAEWNTVLDQLAENTRHWNLSHQNMITYNNRS